MIECECTFINSLMAGTKCDAVNFHSDAVTWWCPTEKNLILMLFSFSFVRHSFFFFYNLMCPVNTHTRFNCPFCKARTTCILTLQEQLTAHHTFLNCWFCPLTIFSPLNIADRGTGRITLKPCLWNFSAPLCRILLMRHRGATTYFRGGVQTNINVTAQIVHTQFLRH